MQKYSKVHEKYAQLGSEFARIQHCGRYFECWDGCHTNRDLEMLTKKAVDLSCGELTDIIIRGFGNDDVLDYIVQRSSKLNRFCHRDCKDITGRGLSRAVKRLPQMEKLHLSHTSMVKRFSAISINCNDHAFAIANSMHELRHLELNDKEMTNDGLKAILNGCPHLESLDMGKCFSLRLEEELVKLCKEGIKNFTWHSTGEDCCFYQKCYDEHEYDYYPGDLYFDVEDDYGY